MIMVLRINEVKAPLGASLDDVLKIATDNLGIKLADIKDWSLAKKSIDARNKSNVYFVYSIDMKLHLDEKDVASKTKWKQFSLEKEVKTEIIKPVVGKEFVRPIVVGSGPAGMLAGIVLAEAGLRPIIVERGKKVQDRNKDVNLFWSKGELNTESNVQFGEGGAGTFSDGKLMTGLKKDELMSKVLAEFVKAGAPDEILYLAKPHIGTDKLKTVVKNIREKIESLGGEYLFEHKLSNIKTNDRNLVAVSLDCRGVVKEFACDKLILAIGHSARDTFEMIHDAGVYIEQKPFAIGARIEHSQELINKSQYGKFAKDKALGAADYKLAIHSSSERSGYTFCMCPGGQVIGASSEEGLLVVNGMSEYARAKENANSALLVGVNPVDFGGDHPLQGMYFQRDIERKAYVIGGGRYKAPVQLIGDFIKGIASKKIGDVKPSYQPDVTPSNLAECLPEFVISAMKNALVGMDNKLKGFTSYDAILTGVETRSSSPIRIIRDENLQANIKGLYPCGEGAGYAGGITSAAMDGIRCAKKIIEACCGN